MNAAPFNEARLLALAEALEAVTGGQPCISVTLTDDADPDRAGVVELDHDILLASLVAHRSALAERDAAVAAALSAIEILDQLTNECAVFAMLNAAQCLRSEDAVEWMQRIGRAVADSKRLRSALPVPTVPPAWTAPAVSR